MRKMTDQEWTEYNAKHALNRLDYAIQTAKDMGNEKPEIRVHLSESTLTISKSQARKYIKDSFFRMDRSHMREASYIASTQSTFRLTLTDYGTLWVDAKLKLTRTEENNRKHALLKIATDEIWGKDEEE